MFHYRTLYDPTPIESDSHCGIVAYHAWCHAQTWNETTIVSDALEHDLFQYKPDDQTAFALPARPERCPHWFSGESWRVREWALLAACRYGVVFVMEDPDGSTTAYHPAPTTLEACRSAAVGQN